jgi:hypothetical protein
MAYEFVFRKYKLKKRCASWYEAKLVWSEQQKERPAEEWLVDEFPIKEKPKGLLQIVVKQITGR